MCVAISRVSGTLGVCFGTTGPGATNLLPGVAAAWADNIPLVALTGNNQSHLVYPAHDNLQDGDHLGLYRPITKWNAVVGHADRAPEIVERALRTARSGRPGPVHLDIPVDVGFQRRRFDLDAAAVAEPTRLAPPTMMKRFPAIGRAAVMRGRSSWTGRVRMIARPSGSG